MRRKGIVSRRPVYREASSALREYRRLVTARPSRFLRFFKGRAGLIATGAGLLGGGMAGLSSLIANFESISSRFKAIQEEQAYVKTLKHPYPSLLGNEELQKPEWTTGKLELARLRIDAYLGNLKNAKTWMKLCVGNAELTSREAASRSGVDLYVNNRTQIAESEIDRLNKIAIQSRISAIEGSQKEDAPLLRINDPFEKLLRRSSTQLLYRYKEKEIDQLDKPQLYLLRNSIYGQHGYAFNTSKLRKYGKRHGWLLNSPKSTDEILSSVERCNAYYLDELHATRELGAMGRGVLVSSPMHSSAPRLFQAAICTCLSQPKFAVECRHSSGASFRTEFRDYVDLVLEIVEGDADRAEWTFLKAVYVSAQDLATFGVHEARFYAAAVDFTAAIQAALAERGIAFSKVPQDRLDAYWGVKLFFKRETLDRLAVDSILAQRVSDAICGAAHDALNQAGPFIPGVAEEAPAPTMTK
jgi:hypothetical protein